MSESSVIPLAHPAVPALRDVVPASIPLGPDGVTHIEGVSAARIAEQFGSPTWVVSRTQIRSNLQTLRDATAAHLGAVEIAYSMKANNNLSVLRTVAAEGVLFDCSSEWELRMVLRAGIAGNRVILNGNGKSAGYLALAVDAGVRQINVDSLAEVHRLDELAERAGRRVSCVVRVKLTYSRLLEHDPSYERTLRVAEAKFGSSIANGEAIAIIDAIQASPWLEFRGLSHHAGFPGYRANYTPDHQLVHVRECVREMAEFAGLLAQRGDPVERLDVGGGLRSGEHVVISTPGDGHDVALHPLPTPEAYAAALAAGLDDGWTEGPRPIIQYETGGFHVANAGVLLTTVQDVKESVFPTKRRFVTVDSAMTMFTTRGSSRVGYPVVAVGKPDGTTPHSTPVEIVGPTCAYDSIAEDISLPDVEPGDLLALLNQGAYAETTSTQFNGFPRPAVVMVDGDQAWLVRRREELADILAREVEEASR
ncbi:diaminopimelate decarboxylase family protein [Agromyces silvae]|uniref:diaminopimelate decarboxylase family protein n=1 Tax=Agromyces silvae TaxID=3388266 RepID=UPI00280AC167|nr:hypothetical protein [Agromyces protaetiae]